MGWNMMKRETGKNFVFLNISIKICASLYIRKPMKDTVPLEDLSDLSKQVNRLHIMYLGRSGRYLCGSNV